MKVMRFFLLLVLKNEAVRYRRRLAFVLLLLLLLLLPTSLVSSSKVPVQTVFKILLFNEINKTISSTTTGLQELDRRRVRDLHDVGLDADLPRNILQLATVSSNGSCQCALSRSATM